MSPSIRVSRVSWTLPGGETVFAGLDLAFGPERTGLIGRNGVGKSTLLRLIAGDVVPPSGTVLVSGRVRMLQQEAQVRPGHTVADLFGATDAIRLVRRATEGLADASELAAADWTIEARIATSLAHVGLRVSIDAPLESLSGGERTRARLAALAFDKPDFLLLDEPTNNLDRAGRHAVIELLAEWGSGAIVVSHDRELLETMDAIVELTSLGATRYGGGWSLYRARKDADLAAARHDLAEAERRLTEVEKRATETAERKAHKDKAGRRARARGGTPRILLGKRKETSEATSGSNARLAARRSEQSRSDAEAARARIEVLQPLTISLASTGLAASKVVARIDRVTAGYDPAAPLLRDYSLTIVGPERLAVVGANGSGKTTLLRVLTGELAPQSGSAAVYVASAALDQQAAILDPRQSILANFGRLNPHSEENSCRAALARFMFRADAAHQMAGTLSGGQLLRAALACVLGGPRPPQLLILDEPTNHLDLDSIAAVEAGLKAYDGALVVVSHDNAFLEAIRIARRLEAPFG